MGFKKKFLKLIRGESQSSQSGPHQAALPPSESASQSPSLRSLPSLPPAAAGQADPANKALVATFLGADAKAAATAAEQLFNATSQSRELCGRLICDVELLYRLRNVLRQQPGGGGSSSGGSGGSEKLQTYAAYLVSAIAGTSAAADAALVDNGLVAALLQLLSATRSWATKRGALRGVAKLLQSAEATAQVAAGGGLAAVAALLDCDDQGLIRRCLSILIHVCASPQAGPAMTDVVLSGGLGPLVRLAECRSAEVQADAVEALKLLCRLPDTGGLLAEIGGIETLARVAKEGHTPGAKAAARIALQRVWEAGQGQPNGQQAVLALRAAGFVGGLAGAAATLRSSGSFAGQGSPAGGVLAHAGAQAGAAQPPFSGTVSAELIRQCLAGLASPSLQTQLAAAQRLRGAAATQCGVQLLSAAQGVHTLLACLSQQRYPAVGSGGRGLVSAEREAVAAAVLGTLSALCQQDPSALHVMVAMLGTLSLQHGAGSVQLAGALTAALSAPPMHLAPSCDGACCAATAGSAEPLTPPNHKLPQQQQQQLYRQLLAGSGSSSSGGGRRADSPYTVLSPSGSNARFGHHHHHHSDSHSCNSEAALPNSRQQYQQQQQQGSSHGPPSGSGSALIISSESALHLLPPSGAFAAAAAKRSPGLWGESSESSLAAQMSAYILGSANGGAGQRPDRSGQQLLSQGSSQLPSPAPRPGQSSGSSGSGLGAAGAATEARDQFYTEAVPGSLLGDDQGCLIHRTDITICLDEAGREVKLGEGGFGTVLKAVMNGVDEVAVKRVRAEAPSAADLALFGKEVATLRALRHRNVVQYYGACMEPGSLFFVTELMTGGDLYSLLRRHPGTLAWRRLGRKVALDVALGLNHLHSRRPPMMHRDLKSPNVLLSEEGVAKIADVGMVRPQLAELVTAQPVLTPLWAAPEVLRRERASLKADVWSYGVLIWELVSGQDISQYQPLAITRQMQQFATGGALGGGDGGDAGHGGALLMGLPRDCPPVAAHIFWQCTQLDPRLRPSAAQVVEWLRAEGQQ